MLKLAAIFNSHLKLFLDGRKDVFDIIEKNIKPNDRTIWFHAASMGEFEQGLPVIEKVKTALPDCKILVTFFSPSGYEIRKNHPVPDVITYLPLDTMQNARRFVTLVNPVLTVFIKYEFWPNYLSELKRNEVPVITIASIFRKNQIFFKSYGGFMRKALKKIDMFFVQDENSVSLLNSIGISNTLLSGDTRFDRVSSILERDNSLDFIEKFKQNQLCLVAGSTWPEDDDALVSYINKTDTNTKFIIAPHAIKAEKIQRLKSHLQKETVLYSEMNTEILADTRVFIIDTIGILTKIYSYADIAYVGGGLGKTGLHNTLEPAVFGIPVIIGPNFDKFKEACDLVALGGIIPIKNADQFAKAVNEFVEKPEKRKEIGEINEKFIKKNKGATQQVLGFICNLIEKK